MIFYTSFFTRQCCEENLHQSAPTALQEILALKGKDDTFNIEGDCHVTVDTAPRNDKITKNLPQGEAFLLAASPGAVRALRTAHLSPDGSRPRMALPPSHRCLQYIASNSPNGWFKSNDEAATKKSPLFWGLISGCFTWTRTKIDGVRIRCPTIRR